MFDFVFYCFNLYKTRWRSNDLFCRKEEYFFEYFHVINFRFSESNMLAEVVKKVLQHNFDVLNYKILVTKLDFVV